MDVYFVNCMLACLLAYLAGYGVATKRWQRIIRGMVMQVVAREGRPMNPP